MTARNEKQCQYATKMQCTCTMHLHSHCEPVLRDTQMRVERYTNENPINTFNACHYCNLS